MVTRASRRQVTLGEISDVYGLKADGETVDERTVEEVDDEPSVFVHVVTARRAGAVVGVGGGAGGVDNQSPGCSTGKARRQGVRKTSCADTTPFRE